MKAKRIEVGTQLSSTALYPVMDGLSKAEVQKFNAKHPWSPGNVRAVATGEKRCPKAGEWFLSGAVPGAYRAPNNLSAEYHIARLIRVSRQVIYTIEQI